MTHELYIKCVLACLAGNVLHIMFKILSLSKDHKVANLQFSVGKYIVDDKWALIFDALGSFLIVFLIDEWLDFEPWVVEKIKSIFVFIGFTGSYFILQALSVAKSNYRKSVDHKTDIADKETGTLGTPTPTKP